MVEFVPPEEVVAGAQDPREHDVGDGVEGGGGARVERGEVAQGDVGVAGLAD